MRKFFLFSLTLLYTLGATFSQAGSQSFETEDGKFSVNYDNSKWEDAKDLFGIPVTILGPMEKEENGRPVIAITPIGKDDGLFNPKELKATEKDYRKGREEWLKQQDGGKALSFIPYKNEKWGNAEVNSIGVNYTLGDGEEFSEKSYYIHCGKKAFHVKTLVGKAVSKYQGEVDSIVKTFSCS